MLQKYVSVPEESWNATREQQFDVDVESARDFRVGESRILLVDLFTLSLLILLFYLLSHCPHEYIVIVTLTTCAVCLICLSHEHNGSFSFSRIYAHPKTHQLVQLLNAEWTILLHYNDNIY